MTSESLSPDHIVDSTQLVPTPLSDDAVALRDARSLVNRAHNAIGSGRYDRQTVKGWLAEADAILKALTPIEGQALSHLKALIAGWEKVEPHVSDMLVTANARTGSTYNGPTDFADALAAARAYVGEGAQQETWESIAAWQRETFGPVALDRQAKRAAEEMDELLADPTDVGEAADVCIVLAGYPGIRDAIERKMAINRARQWKLNGDGTGYHVKDREGGA